MRYMSMAGNFSGFRAFFEADMDPSADKRLGANQKQPAKMDYFDELGDEMGMQWQDIVSSLEKEPWVAAHFSLGSPKHEMMYKTSAWKIVPGTLSQNGATIQLKHQKNDRSYLHGGKMLNKGSPDTKTYHLNRQQLMAFLTAGWQPAVQQAQAGGMPGVGGPPGMPPGGGLGGI